jgi:hypothetical protein
MRAARLDQCAVRRYISPPHGRLGSGSAQDPDSGPPSGRREWSARATPVDRWYQSAASLGRHQEGWCANPGRSNGRTILMP